MKKSNPKLITLEYYEDQTILREIKNKNLKMEIQTKVLKLYLGIKGMLLLEIE